MASTPQEDQIADAIRAAIEADHLALRHALFEAFGPFITADVLSKIAYARNTQPRAS